MLFPCAFLLFSFYRKSVNIWPFSTILSYTWHELEINKAFILPEKYIEITCLLPFCSTTHCKILLNGNENIIIPNHICSILRIGHLISYKVYLRTVLVFSRVRCIKNARPEFNLYASTHTSNVFRNTRSLALLWNNQAAWNFGIIKTGHSILAITIDLILTTEKIFEYSKKLDGNNELKDNCINLYNTEVG